MKPILFVLLLAMGAFAAEAADGSNLQTDGSNLQTDGSNLQQDSSVQQATDSLQQSVGSAQTSDTANNPDGNSNWPNSAHVICEMPDDDDDPETTVRENIGLVNDSLAPLGEYVEWADSSKVADSLPTADTLAAVDSLPKVDSLDVEKPAVVESQKNIPLPRQTAYTGKGLSVGIGAGVFQPTVDCDCMGIWQAQVEFFYTDWISGGGDVRYFGGNLDKSSMLMYQRFRIDARFHKTWSNFDIYGEPVFGFETTSISEFRSQVKDDFNGIVNGDSSSAPSDTSEKALTECEKMFSLDGFSIGVGGGFGWKPSRYFGVTGSALFEYSFSNSALLSITPGVAVNVQEFWPWGRNNLRSIWLSAEFGVQRYFNRGVGDWSLHGIFGIQLTI